MREVVIDSRVHCDAGCGAVGPCELADSRIDAPIEGKSGIAPMAQF